LRDTVLSYNEFNGAGNGFTFFNYNAHDMLHTIERAVQFYNQKKNVWSVIQERGMKGDYSWTHSASEYMRLYQNVQSCNANQLSDNQEPEKENPVVVNIDGK